MRVRAMSIVLGLLLAPMAHGQVWGELDDAPAKKPSSGDAQGPQPKLVVEKDKIDLGEVKEGETVDAVFVLENKGDADLKIENVRTSCGCTTVKLTDQEKIIAPGGKQKVTARFNTKGRPGKQSKTVTVVSNDPEQANLKLTLTADVLTLVNVVPSTLILNNVRRGEVAPRALDVLAGSEEGEIEIVSLEVPGDILSYTTEPVDGKGRRGHRLRFRVDPDASIGVVATSAKLKVRVGDKTEVKQIRVQGTIIGDLAIRPASINLPKASVRGIQLRPVTIESVARKPFQVFGASAGPSFETTVTPDKKNTEYTVLLKIAEGAPDGPCGVFLEVRTDSVEQPVIRVPVYANIASRLEIEPPDVLLKPDGSPEGKARRVLLSTPTGAAFTILGVECDQNFIEVSPVESARERPDRRVLRVALSDGVDPGSDSATIVLRTDVPGAERVELPVTVIAGGSPKPAS